MLSMDTLSTFIDQLDSFGYLIIGVNLLLMLFARVLLKQVYNEPDKISSFSRKVMIFRALNLAYYSRLRLFSFLSR